MPAIPKPLISEQEYLIKERKAPHKSEYYKGETFAMAGASYAHNIILGSLILAIGTHLKGKKCSFVPSDLRVHNPENTLYTYPDAIVICDEPKFVDDTFDTLLNPTIIFEVLSPSTEDYDRGTKFKLYRSIPSLQNYVVISSTEAYIEVYTRNNAQWILSTAKAKEEKIEISAIDLQLHLADVYEQIESF